MDAMDKKKTPRLWAVRPVTRGFTKKKNGERGGTRTRGHRIKSPMLYRLSYPSTSLINTGTLGRDIMIVLGED
jgi:hypothetical protein